MKTKVAIYLSLVALLGAILFQNIDTISLQILLFEFQIPLVLLMVVMFALGALTYGLLDYFSVKKRFFRIEISPQHKPALLPAIPQ